MEGRSHLGIGIAMGVAIGAGIGVAMDDMAVGISMGIAIGVALGLAMGAGRKSPQEPDGKAHRSDVSGHAGDADGSDSGSGDGGD